MKTLSAFLAAQLRLLIILSIVISAISCEESNPVIDEPSVKSRGDIIESNLVKTYSAEEVGAVLSLLGIPFPYEQTFAVQYVSIVYQTVDAHGSSSIASGGLYIPVTTGSLPILSLQHGTEVKRENVASTSPLSSVEATTGLLTGSMGYVTAVPDYIGFGVSTTIHPYMHASSLSAEVVDFLRAVKIYSSEKNIALNDQLFLTGYSEGGYATLAAQKDIEQNYPDEFQITAAAPLAGPYDIAGTILDGFQKLTYPEPAYIAFLFSAYNEIYGWDRLGDIIAAPYSSQVAGMFNGSQTWGEVINQLPDSMDDLVKQEFIADYLNGSESQIKSAFEENTLLNWSPASPICFIHGTDDQIVPYKNALTAYENLSLLTNVEIKLIPIPGGTHETSGVPAILLMLEYFETFRGSLILARAN